MSKLSQEEFINKYGGGSSPSEEAFIKKYNQEEVGHVKVIEVRKEVLRVPSNKDLTDLILRLMPRVKNGKTPTEKELLSLIKPLIPKVKNVKMPSDRKLLALIRPLIPTPKPGKNGSPDKPEDIVRKLESLKGDKRLDRSAIKGLEDLITLINNKGNNNNPVGRGTRKGIFVHINGEGKGFFDNINLIPGIGVSLTHSVDGGKNNITINASASTSVLAATGTVNDSNLAFTFASEPAILIINGASYRQTGGAITWTWDSGSLTVTLSSPVGTGGSIFGLA